MSLFVDQLLLQLRDHAQLIQLVDPAGDTNHTRLRKLLNTMYGLEFATIMYDLKFATIHDIRNIKVQQVEFQRLLLPPHRTQGTWTQLIPSYTRTDVVYEGSEKLEPIWLDVAASVGLTLLLEIDSGEAESIVFKAIEHFKTLDEFRAHFLFIDLESFMAEHDITTVEQLREHAHYLLAEIRLRKPVLFDPNDPANLHSYTLNLAILIRDAIDVTGVLRDVKLARVALERSLSYRKEFDGNEVRVPYAPIVIFPEASLGGLPFNADTLQTFLAAEGILALFMTPPSA